MKFAPKDSGMKRRKRIRGFSTMEFLMTITILAFVSLIAVPYFSGQMPRYRLDGAALEVMGDLMWVRMEAVSQNREYKVSFQGHDRYKIVAKNPEKIRKERNIQDEYQDVTFTVEGAPVIFYGRGTATVSTITLTNSSGSRQVQVRSTGQVKIN
jgi:type IV fimbrial biogenesis protein FimT